MDKYNPKNGFKFWQNISSLQRYHYANCMRIYGFKKYLFSNEAYDLAKNKLLDTTAIFVKGKMKCSLSKIEPSVVSFNFCLLIKSNFNQVKAFSGSTTYLLLDMDKKRIMGFGTECECKKLAKGTKFVIVKNNAKIRKQICKKDPDGKWNWQYIGRDLFFINGWNFYNEYEVPESIKRRGNHDEEYGYKISKDYEPNYIYNYLGSFNH